MVHLRGMGERNAVRVRKAHATRRALHCAAQIYEERFAHPLGGADEFQLCYMRGGAADVACKGARRS